MIQPSGVASPVAIETRLPYEYASPTASTITEPRGASDRWLPYNVPEAAMQTKAVLKDGKWVINGIKHFISCADVTDVIMVMTSTDPAKKARGEAAKVSGAEVAKQLGLKVGDRLG